MISYKVSDLEGLARLFEHFAKKVQDRQTRATKVKEAAILAAEYRTWQQAAQTVRQTELLKEASPGIM